MKKLLIILASATVLAFGARADEVPVAAPFSGTTGTDFEGYAAEKEFDPLLDDNGEEILGRYWLPITDADGDLPKFVAVTNAGNVSGLTLGSRALKIDDTPVTRTINAVDGTSVTTNAIGNGIFFDSLVQFTASSQAPVVEEGSDEKLIVWLYGPEGDDPADQPFGDEGALFITAGMLKTDCSFDRAVNFRVLPSTSIDGTSIDVQPNTWHRLTIKAFYDFELGDRDAGTKVTRFEVFVDGKQAAASDADDDMAESQTTFASLRNFDYKDAKNLWSVTFQGQGAVDQLWFKDDDPFPTAATKFDFYLEDLTDEESDAFESYNSICFKYGSNDFLDVTDESLFSGVDEDYYKGYLKFPVEATEITYRLSLPADYEVEGWVKGDADAVNPGSYFWTKTFVIADMEATDGVYSASFTITEVAGGDTGDGGEEEPPAVDPITVSVNPSAENVVLTGMLAQDGNGEWVAFTDYAIDNGQITVTATPGTKVKFVFGPASGYVMAPYTTGEYTISEASMDVTVDATPAELEDPWLTALGDGATYDEESGAYVLTTEGNLRGLMSQVNDGEDTTDMIFKLDNDIALTNAWEGIGVYNNASIGNAFCGTFDGCGYTISNLVFKNVEGHNDYRGFFNQAWGATIKDLTVNVNGFEAGATGKCGAAAIAGHAYGTTITGCTSKGSLLNLTHNAAGMVVRGNGIALKNCTNEVNISAAYTKMAGFIAITQGAKNNGIINQDSAENCVNKGTVTATGGTNPAVAGIIAWAGDTGDAPFLFKNCSNEGVISGGNVSGVKVGQLGVEGYGSGVTYEGTNTGRADQLLSTLAWSGTPGFATVDGNVATYIAKSAVVPGGTYLVATSNWDAPKIVLGENETISFDYSLTTLNSEKNITMSAELDQDQYELTRTENEETHVVTFAVVEKSAPQDGFDAGTYADVDEMLEKMSSASDILVTGTATIEMVVEDENTHVKTITFGDKVATIPAYYNVAVNAGENGFSLSLNDLATPLIQEGEIESETKPAIEIVDGKFVVTVKGYEGLYYSLWECDEPNGEFTKVAGSDTEGAEAFQLNATMGEDTKKFYKVKVTDIAPAK